MSKNEYYIAEIAAMSYFWFLKEHLIKTLKFKNIFFNNPVIDNTLNFILFPFYSSTGFWDHQQPLFISDSTSLIHSPNRK